ncbi:hypothetical protein HYW75_02340 [Candidatus Pacearchaeota archaeon]|nr:hypothetical protein [Candidatus Pacearchaeota archaeon]
MNHYVDDRKIYAIGLGLFFLFVGYIIFIESKLYNMTNEKSPRLNEQYTTDRHYNTNQMGLENTLIK